MKCENRSLTFNTSDILVYSPLKAAAKYFQYYIHAANSRGHGTHSPFMFEFITRVMNDFTDYADYKRIDALRQRLLRDYTKVQVTDFGAGSGVDNSEERTVASIARYSVKPAKFARLMYRMVRYYHFQHLLELGTSLGVTSCYLAAANSDGELVTLEGADGVADLAEQHFKELDLKNIRLIRGNIDDTLPLALESLPKVDFAFLDGNHRQEPTERYFNLLLPKVHNDTLLVIDDIHWSEEMEAAWKTITGHPAVMASVDLYYLGIVSFRKEFREKEQFQVRF